MSVTTQPLHEWQIGDYIADMHYGEEQLHAQFTVLAHIRWDEPTLVRPTSDGYPEHAFFRYLGQYMSEGRLNLNKCLYVIGFANNSTLSEPVIIAGYCYDGRRSGIVVLASKSREVTEPDGILSLRNCKRMLRESLDATKPLVARVKELEDELRELRDQKIRRKLV